MGRRRGLRLVRWNVLVSRVPTRIGISTPFAARIGERLRAKGLVSGRPTAAEGRGPANTLESSGNSCGSSSDDVADNDDPGSWCETWWELRECHCKSWFCPKCAKRMGYALRRRVVEVVNTFQAVAMISLTVDRTLFRNAQEAYEWVRGKHGIGLLIKNLRRKGWLDSARYIWFIEFQKAGWPHWHILVDAKYVPAALVYELWGKLRPAGIEQVPGRPPFGKVDVSAGKFLNGAHAANYGTKYVIKEPREGWPDWVWEFEGRVAHYGVSRGFWGTAGRRCATAGPEVVAVPHPAECFCEDCREGRDVATGKARRPVRTIRERVARCGRGTMLFRVRGEWDADGDKVCEDRFLVGISGRGFPEVCGMAVVEARPVGMVRLNRAEVRRVWTEFCGLPGVVDKFDRSLCSWVPF